MAEKRKELYVFSVGQRFAHWLHTAAFVVLMITGAMLYIPWFSQSIARGDGGNMVRLVHRIGAIAFILVPILYVVLDLKGFLADMKRILTWSKEDLGWAKAAPAYYFMGDDKAMPPQDKFNTGQKLFYLVVAVCMILFIVTGLVMWFGRGVVPVWMFQWSVFLHDLSTIAYAAFFLVHFMLSVVHPLMKGALNGMIFGWMPEEYVKHHHAKYYQKLQSGKE
ncbi:MAG: cytochrome b/b6 domain-containing protein [Anaerolineae bacterium]|nr:cytochrome b/b6 domain-containing protein [Anaerolineae bacterium]